VVREVKVKAGDALEYLAKLRKELEDPEALLKQFGALVVSQAQRAFREQEFDGKPWPGRYPNQEDPVVNLAGVVQDLEGGLEKPKANRFDRRPAGKDSGGLWNSIIDKSQSVKVSGTYAVEVGSVLEQASRIQFGGVHSQSVSPSTRQKIGRYIKTAEGAPHWWRLLFLTADETTEISTDVVPRPYLGMTQELERKIIETAERDLEEMKPEER